MALFSLPLGVTPLALIALLSPLPSRANSPNPTPQPTVSPRPLPPRPVLPLAPFGNRQIVLNGQPFYGAWTQWQVGNSSRIGISDAALTQLFGVQLLSTANVSQQPVQWFSDSVSVLPTRLDSTSRYLDITEFAQKNGWQLQIEGNQLQVSTQPAKVRLIRQEQQSWGDRITIDLDRPTPWQADPQSLEFLLTLNAQLGSPAAQVFKPTPASKIRTFQLETLPSQTRLKIGIPWRVRPQITTQANRIIIEVGTPYLPARDIAWMPGLRWRQQYITVGNAQFPAVWLEVDPKQPQLSVRPLLSNTSRVPGTAPLFRTAQQGGAIAAINGGFFNRINQLPLGAIRLNNQWLSSPILTRGVVAWNNDGNLRVDRLVLQETAIALNQRFGLTALNSGYVQAGIARYTPDWGTLYTTLSDNEVLVTVQNNQVTQQTTVEKAGSAVPMPTSGYLLVLRSNRSAASSFAIGTAVQLEATLTPPDLANYSTILGAGPLLIQNGQTVLDATAERFSRAFIEEQAARSAIGQAPNGTILIVAVHDRLGGLGATLSDIASIMKQLGATNALNLDGGSSTTLYLGGQILDRPPNFTTSVHNGIGIFFQPSSF
ncbi:phosphodiester glycosidase family protein [Myxacorys almedinensis A]|uniref:Phosphodiester glycosidase family protein n=1 Tax=Myxacorys almedinensis A TaxID=2690445 RepID=A0A8J7YZM7_9CYAN|nr:phosphodiester glycosidase family protein [Myxacorys almedinensis A]